MNPISLTLRQNQQTALTSSQIDANTVAIQNSINSLATGLGTPSFTSLQTMESQANVSGVIYTCITANGTVSAIFNGSSLTDASGSYSTYAGLVIDSQTGYLPAGEYFAKDKNSLFIWNGSTLTFGDSSQTKGTVFNTIALLQAAKTANTLLQGIYQIPGSGNGLTITVTGTGTSAVLTGSGSYATYAALQTDSASGNLPNGSYFIPSVGHYDWNGTTLTSSAPVGYTTYAALQADLATGKLVANTVYAAGGASFVYNGAKLIPSSGILARIASIRPKIATFGNSLNVFSQLGAGVNPPPFPVWGSQSVVTWISALTNAAFDRARSNPYNFGLRYGSGDTSNETLDSLGNYAWGGARLNQLQGLGILDRLPMVCDLFIDTPDIVYFANMLENDIANPGDWGSNYSTGYAAITKAINDAVMIVTAKWPNCLIIFACPNPSKFYNTTAAQNMYTGICNYMQNTLPTLYNNVLIENNTACVDTTSANPGQVQSSYLTWAGTNTSITAGGTANSSAITVASTAGFAVGNALIGYNFQPDTLITSIVGSVINMSKPLSGNMPYPVTNVGVGDGVHPNTVGALKRALAFISQFSWLFPNRLNLSKQQYVNGKFPVQQSKNFAFNPDFTKIGAPGQNAGTSNGTTIDKQYFGFDFYGNTGITANITQNISGSGIDIAVSATGTAYTVPTAIGINSDNASASIGINNLAIQGAFNIVVNNSDNIYLINTGVVISGGTAINPEGLIPETNFPYYFPGGISGIIPSGTEMTIVTPPAVAGNNNSIYEANLNLIAAPSLVSGTPVNQEPNITIKSYQVMSVDIPQQTTALNMATALSPAVSGGGNGVQQITVGSATGLSVGMFIVGTNIPVGTYIESISGTTVTLNQPMTGNPSGTYYFETMYMNNTSKAQQIVVGNSGVTFTKLDIYSGQSSISAGLTATLITLSPGQMFTASWSAGTPTFTLNLLT